MIMDFMITWTCVSETDMFQFRICQTCTGKYAFYLYKHSEDKGYQNSVPGVLLLQMVPFFLKGHSFSLIIMFMKKKSTPLGPQGVPFV